MAAVALAFLRLLLHPLFVIAHFARWRQGVFAVAAYLVYLALMPHAAVIPLEGGGVTLIPLDIVNDTVTVDSVRSLQRQRLRVAYPSCSTHRQTNCAAALSLVAAAYDCLAPYPDSTLLPQAWSLPPLQDCVPNAGALSFLSVHFFFVIFPLLFWCCSIIARWNEAEQLRDCHSGMNGGRNGGNVTLRQAHDMDQPEDKLASSYSAHSLDRGSEGRCAHSHTSGVPTGWLPRLQLRVQQWTVAAPIAAWAWLLFDVLTLMPMLYMHRIIMRRAAAAMTVLVLVAGPGFGWVLPLAAVFLFLRARRTGN